MVTFWSLLNVFVVAPSYHSVANYNDIFEDTCVQTVTGHRFLGGFIGYSVDPELCDAEGSSGSPIY